MSDKKHTVSESADKITLKSKVVRGQRTKMNYCNQLADRLGWEEGKEYTISKKNYSQTAQPALRKAGWRTLFRMFVEGDRGESE